MSIRELASVDGAVAPTAESVVPLPDDGLYRGDGAFEVIRLYGGEPFALGDHLDRLDRSAAAIELSYERPALELEIRGLLAAFGEHDAQIRIIVTRGGRRIVATEPLPPHGATLALATVTYSTSVILNGVKSLSYAANMQASRIARNKGADEAVLVRTDGIVLEAPTSAVFWAPAGAGRLRTPSLEVGVLESITRSRILEEMDVEEGALDVSDLCGADEAFLASTTREVQPVASVDGRELPLTPGPLTEQAREAFAGLRDAELG